MLDVVQLLVEHGDARIVRGGCNDRVEVVRTVVAIENLQREPNWDVAIVAEGPHERVDGAERVLPMDDREQIEARHEVERLGAELLPPPLHILLGHDRLSEVRRRMSNRLFSNGVGVMDELCGCPDLADEIDRRTM